MRNRVLALVLLAASPAAAFADEVRATSEVDLVTVFPQGAEVTRLAKVTIPQGSHTVVLKDLPAALLQDSIRVQGEATGQIEIGSADVRLFYLSEDADAAVINERKRLEAELEKLNDERQGLQGTIDAANTQKQLIQNLTALPTRPEPSGGQSASTDWGGIFALIGERLAIANKTIVETGVALRDLDRKIADLQNQLSQQPGQELQRTELKVNVVAEQAVEATLRVRYQVDYASWVPVYDARLETGSAKEAPKLVLARRAIIAQQTGEDWTNVALTLSTTRPKAGTDAPDLMPIAVDVLELARGRLLKQKAEDGEQYDAAGSRIGTVANEEPAMTVAPEAAPKPADERQAVVLNTAFQVLYDITDRQTVKSQGGDKRVQIDSKSFEPALGVRTVPKSAALAYLYAKLTLDPETLVLPGQVSLFRDGVFVGHGGLPQLAGGEEHELGFGVDDKIKVEFADLGRKSGETGLISTSKTDTQSFKMTVRNLHERAMQVRLLDQLPVSANEKIKVEMLAGTTPPSVKDLDDERGVLAWDLVIEPEAEAVVNFAYEVTWPNGVEIVYEPRPGPWPLQQ